MNTFQRAYNPLRPDIRKLYIKSDLSDTPSPPTIENNENHIYQFKKNEVVDFGEFFNTVFEDEVSTITTISKLTLRLELKGKFSIRIFRVLPNLGGRVIYDSIKNTNGEFVNWEQEVDLITGKSSRLFFSLKSLSKKGVLASADWGVESEGRDDIKLCLVTTTFKNESLINSNIEYILSDDEVKDYPIEVVVVDNAATYTPKIQDARLHLIPQENVGGAGGFTRGIYEVVYGKLKDKGFTHILLMDDDIKLHLSSVIRIYKMYQYGAGKTALGGCMLDLNRPDFLFEAGAFSCRKKPIGSHNDVIYAEANECHNLDTVGHTTDYDYCGWWFFSFPVEAVNEVGLPKPVFIRGDDVDYGIRLRQAGYKNYCLGGVGVWHLHFLEKPISWIVYYVFRNHLILLSTSHQDRGWQTEDIIKELKNTIFYNICQYDYAHAALVLLAMEDFLKGPDFLKNENANDVLKNVFATHKQYQTKLDPKELREVPNTERQPDKKHINYIKKISLNYQKGPFKKKTKRGFETVHGEFPPTWKHSPEQNGYILIDGIRNVKRAFERKPHLVVELDNRAKILMDRFTKEYPTVAQQFEDNADNMHSKEYWEAYFKSNGCM